ncbi:MAG TPA: YhjD/YihY/BrkB family envelope integrity protein [Rhodocyclaceae bacterium]
MGEEREVEPAAPEAPADAASPPVALPHWRERVDGALQILVTTTRLFLRNELENHAAAVAFYFLLSVVPVVFIVLWLTGTVLQAPALSAHFVELLSGIDQRLSLDELRAAGLLPDAAAGTVGGLSLLAMLWASRQLVLAVQAAFRVINADAQPRAAYLDWMVSLLLVPGAILVIATVSIGRQLIAFLASLAGSGWLADTAPALAGLVSHGLTLTIVWLIVVAAFSGLPPRRPPARVVVRVALLCVLSLVALRVLFATFVSLDRYQGIYSSLGTLIFVLFWVFLAFLVFFFWAQCLYAATHLDAIALEKLMLSAGGERSWLDRHLFGRKSRLTRKFGQSYSAGQVIVREGDESQVAFYLDEGHVGLYRGHSDDTSGERLAAVEAGGTFGEMAYLLKERRSATAIAETDVSVYIIPPTLFEELLALNPRLSRRIIETLAERLRQMNELH